QRAEGEVLRAEADLRLAQVRQERLEDALAKGAATDIELIEAQANVAAAEGALEIARSNLNQAKLDLSYTEVRSPIRGRVDREYVDAGNLVGASERTLLTTVVCMNPIYAYFDVSERNALRYLARGDDGRVRDDAPPVFLGLANEKGYPHVGRLDYVENVLDPDTGTLRVRASFPNDDNLLYPGLYARIRVPFETIPDAILIDENALQRDLTGDYIITIDEQNTAQRAYITLGDRYDGGRVHVLEGLSPDQRYVVSGLQKARPGAQVNPQQRGQQQQQQQPTSTPSSPAAQNAASEDDSE
ncbi:MAG: efflux RND transporter periplasmic adaptor subunit, partial [Planctomycetota bacterium]|nr:efflux RND transporter periplasmic adaptor subunit [Planctomycetota bacterium]